jgi:hypothetical protein
MLCAGVRKIRALIRFSKLLEKKEQGHGPARKIVSTLFPRMLDLSLLDGATLLVRARAPPETWTTRREPFGQSEDRIGSPSF